MRSRVHTRRGKRGESSSEERSVTRIEERLEIQDANSLTDNDGNCECGETHFQAEVQCDTCGSVSDPQEG